MSQKQTVTINGRDYDARTGLPVTSEHTSRAALRGGHPEAHQSATPVEHRATPHHTAAHRSTPAQHIHKKTQKSVTLNRKFTKKPQAPAHATSASPTASVVAQARRHHAPLAPPISHHGTPTSKPTAVKLAHTPRKSLDLKPVTKPVPHGTHTPTHTSISADIHRPHPIATRAHQVQAAKKTTPAAVLPSASALKQATINEALAKAPAHHAKQHKHSAHKQRLVGVVFGCLALVLFGGYLTYLNVPNLSVRVAAAQAGIDASYPGYQPDGYRLNGPVAYSNGQVQMKFAANTGTSDYTLKQSKSSWDSSALLENYVREKSGDEYTTSEEKGITIYSYKGNAAWVSGGILYTIDGNAPLSPDQIRKIATSV